MSSGGKHDTAAPRSRTGRRVTVVLGALAVACGLVVGGAHWQLHRMQTSVVWSTPLDHSDETLVAAGRVYTHDISGFQVTRLSDGKQLASVPSSTTKLLVGHDGHFAVLDGTRLDFYSPDGTELWQRRIEERAPAGPVVMAIGAGTTTYRDCGRRAGPACALRTVDHAGKDVWSLPAPGLPSEPFRHLEALRQDEVTDGNGPMLQPVPSVPVVQRDGRLVQLDDAGRPSGESIASDHATAVGDLMIESTRAGSTCRYRGVRRGQIAWIGQADCAGVGEITDVIAFRQRMYVGYDADPDSAMSHPLRMVSVDLTDGTAHAFDHGWSAALADPDKTTIVAPDVVVEQDRRALTGHSPATGKKLWSRSFDEKAQYSTVQASAGAVTMHSQGAGLWRKLAVGTHSPQNVMTLLDPRTGDRDARIQQNDPFLVTRVGAGALVIADGRLLLVRTRS